VKTTGDGMLVKFASVVEAVRCAFEVQQEIVKRNAEVPQEKRIEFRIGINVGDIIIDGNDIFGDGVNVAARLEAIAEPSGILISRQIYDQIEGKARPTIPTTGSSGSEKHRQAGRGICDR
jgi:adenylate cyclase